MRASGGEAGSLVPGLVALAIGGRAPRYNRLSVAPRPCRESTVELGNQLILLGAFLLLLSIFVGLVSSRIGAPLLLAFLGLGMFFGEDGPGGIFFDNYFAAYIIGSIALAIILFDGGLRTDFGNFRLAAWPALLLATRRRGRHRGADRRRGAAGSSGWAGSRAS